MFLDSAQFGCSDRRGSKSFRERNSDLNEINEFGCAWMAVVRSKLNSCRIEAFCIIELLSILKENINLFFGCGSILFEWRLLNTERKEVSVEYVLVSAKTTRERKRGERWCFGRETVLREILECTLMSEKVTYPESIGGYVLEKSTSGRIRWYF